MDERRKQPRVPLDCPVFVTFKIKTGEEVYCLFRDVSLCGAMVALPPGDDGSSILPGDEIIVTEASEELQGMLDGMKATVAWSRGENFGIQFPDLDIPHEALEQMLTDCCF